MNLSRTIKVTAIAIIILIIAGFTNAFAAANTLPLTTAGDGSGAISGYTVSNVVYHLNVADPSTIDSVTFTLSASATTVKISLTGVAPYITCTVTGGTSVSCTTTGATVLSATSLRVIASS